MTSTYFRYSCNYICRESIVTKVFHGRCYFSILAYTIVVNINVTTYAMPRFSILCACIYKKKLRSKLFSFVAIERIWTVTNTNSNKMNKFCTGNQAILLQLQASVREHFLHSGISGSFRSTLTKLIPVYKTWQLGLEPLQIYRGTGELGIPITTVLQKSKCEYVDQYHNIMYN